MEDFESQLKVAIKFLPTLSKRELEVFKMTGLGLTNREIAQVLYISLDTVTTHVKRIYSKLYIKGQRRISVLAHHIFYKEG